MTRRSLALVAAALVAAATFIIWRANRTSETVVSDEAVIAHGRGLYDENCASCHGADLQGQPNWKIPLENGRYPAPPHDETGHTWHHADALLEQIIREGSAAVVGNGYESDMPGFGDVLSDDQITAILAYIKSTWPARERAIQARVTQDSTR